MLSPTSINTYIACPRSYYFKYIKSIRQPLSKYMLRGTHVHSIIESVFKLKSPKGLSKFVNDELDKVWHMKGAQDISGEEEIAKFKEETKAMLDTFVQILEIKIKGLMLEGVCKNEVHAWNTIKPRSQEEYLKIPEIGLGGKVDAIHQCEWGETKKTVYIIDYKTSKLYNFQVSKDYILQGKLYCLMYWKKYGEMPTHVGFNYIRYGETMNFIVDEKILKETEEFVIDIRKKTLSEDIKDYPCTCGCKTDMCKLYDVDEKGNVINKEEKKNEQVEIKTIV
jgi:putative RecB family exonuclease